jgi:hypothetical protein
MADSPAHPIPLDPREQPILENLERLRDELYVLKQDRSTYVKSSDVMALYNKVVEQVRSLHEIRGEKPVEENRGQYCPLGRCAITDWSFHSGSRLGFMFPITLALFYDHRQEQ